jgi:indolepyruvate ferredoxin oxidoreductase alpha subunit
VVASGIAWNYLMENQPGEDVSLLKVGSYPPPRALFEALLDHCERILVLEDGYPFLEQALLGLLGRTARPMHGRLDGSLPRTGELNPSIVRRALGLPALESASPELGELPGRPPALCKGCPHADTYRVIREVMDGHPEGRVFSDIGCYTLGALAPYEAIHTCVDMGASVSMAHGAAVVGLHPSLAVIGDSTFAHSGITPLLDAVRNDTRMVLIILDNDITAMTGRQESACTGEKLVRLLLGLGVPEAHLRRIRPHPKDHAANVAVLREEIEHPGLSVILAVRPCIQIRPA